MLRSSPDPFPLIGVEVVKISGVLREISSVGFRLCGVLFLSGIVEAADHPAFQPVKELFAAMSKHDGKAMQETSTEDFQLLEHGEDWTMQKLVDAVQPKGEPYERKNFFSQIRAREKGNVAWVSYWNKAEISRASGLRTVVWLESAVIIREDDRWKIQLLHSTRLEPDKYPKNIQWVQFEATP
jgi:ketosteroid isomerase-like protein